MAAAFAICISERTPSCILAPPDAEMMISGYLRSSASWPKRAIFSPTTEPIEPPMNAKSMIARHTGIPPSWPVKVRMRSEERRVGKSVDLGGRRIIKKKNKHLLRPDHDEGWSAVWIAPRHVNVLHP